MNFIKYLQEDVQRPINWRTEESRSWWEYLKYRSEEEALKNGELKKSRVRDFSKTFADTSRFSIWFNQIPLSFS